MFLGRSELGSLSVTATPMAGDPQYVFGAVTWTHQQTETQTEPVARGGRRLTGKHRGKNLAKSALRGGLSLDNRGPHKGSA